MLFYEKGNYVSSLPILIYIFLSIFCQKLLTINNNLSIILMLKQKKY